VVHASIALLFGVLAVTGIALFFTPLTALVGRRELVEDIHLYAGPAA
jgi:cytochrome b subunit of formate dehydrogenase